MTLAWGRTADVVVGLGGLVLFVGPVLALPDAWGDLVVDDPPWWGVFFAVGFFGGYGLVATCCAGLVTGHYRRHQTGFERVGVVAAGVVVLSLFLGLAGLIGSLLTVGS